MGGLMGFGILGILPSDASAEEKLNILKDICSKNFSYQFSEVDKASMTVFTYSTKEGLKQNAIEKDSELFIAADNISPINLDDWGDIFEADIYFPNSALGNDHDYLEIEGEDKMVISLEYFIQKAIETKTSYESEDEETIEELADDIERMADYIEFFETAKKHNLIVSFSY